MVDDKTENRGEQLVDKFNKTAIILIIAAVVVIVIMAYVSYYYIDGAPSQLPSTDGSVNAQAGSTGDVYYNPFNVEYWGNTGENIGFTTVGCIGGLIAGYIYPTIFSKEEKGGKNQKMLFSGILPVFLTGDPLNGIGTITGFLVFAMIGRKIQLRKMKQKVN